MYLWVAPMLAAGVSLSQNLMSTVDVFILHLYWKNKLLELEFVVGSAKHFLFVRRPALMWLHVS